MSIPFSRHISILTLNDRCLCYLNLSTTTIAQHFYVYFTRVGLKGHRQWSQITKNAKCFNSVVCRTFDIQPAFKQRRDSSKLINRRGDEQRSELGR